MYMRGQLIGISASFLPMWILGIRLRLGAFLGSLFVYLLINSEQVKAHVSVDCGELLLKNGETGRSPWRCQGLEDP